MANQAQRNLAYLLDKIPMADGMERDFVIANIRAWEGYDDMWYSSPTHQIKDLEEKFGMRIADINNKYNSDNVRFSVEKINS